MWIKHAYTQLIAMTRYVSLNSSSLFVDNIIGTPKHQVLFTYGYETLENFVFIFLFIFLNSIRNKYYLKNIIYVTKIQHSVNVKTFSYLYFWSKVSLYYTCNYQSIKTSSLLFVTINFDNDLWSIQIFQLFQVDLNLLIRVLLSNWVKRNLKIMSYVTRIYS